MPLCNQNMILQDAEVIMAAPITGPIAGPKTVPAKKTPMAKPLCSYTMSDIVPEFAFRLLHTGSKMSPIRACPAIKKYEFSSEDIIRITMKHPKFGDNAVPILERQNMIIAT